MSEGPAASCCDGDGDGDVASTAEAETMDALRAVCCTRLGAERGVSLQSAEEGLCRVG